MEGPFGFLSAHPKATSIARSLSFDTVLICSKKASGLWCNVGSAFKRFIREVERLILRTTGLSSEARGSEGDDMGYDSEVIGVAASSDTVGRRGVGEIGEDGAGVTFAVVCR